MSQAAVVTNPGPVSPAQSLSDDDRRKLQHMLGAIPGHYPRSKWGFRNHYATNGGPALDALRRMQALGLVSHGRTSGRMEFFHATELGCRAIGLDNKQIQRALED